MARASVKVADVVAMLALEGFAIGERYAEKDAYDIYMLCAHRAGGPRAVAERLRPARDEGPVRRGLAAIAEKFRAREAEGPTWAHRVGRETPMARGPSRAASLHGDISRPAARRCGGRPRGASRTRAM